VPVKFIFVYAYGKMERKIISSLSLKIVTFLVYGFPHLSNESWNSNLFIKRAIVCIKFDLSGKKVGKTSQEYKP
jgi:hypothetical protein